MMIDNGDCGDNGASNENVNNTRDNITDDNDTSNEGEKHYMDIINDENSQTKNYSHQSSSSSSNIAIIGPGLTKVIVYLQLLDPSTSSSTNPFDDNGDTGGNSNSSSNNKSNNNHNNNDEKHCWEKEVLPTLRFHDLVFGFISNINIISTIIRYQE